MLGYELPIHKIMPFDVFISICEKKDTKKRKLEPKKKRKAKQKIRKQRIKGKFNSFPLVVRSTLL